MLFKLISRKVFLCLFFVSSTAHAQSKQPYQPPLFLDQERSTKIQNSAPTIDKIVKDFVQQKNIPGYAFAILLDGNIIHSGSGGYIDLKKKIPATIKSQFRIASMTKSLTAMAILKLRDEGKLKLDTPVSFFIPEIKNQKLTLDSPEITIQNLLTHSSGLPEDNPWGDRQLEKTNDDLISLWKKGVSFSNATGVNYEYSNLAYATLGYIIKKVSGMPYQQYISKNILAPLNIQDAYWEYSKISPSLLAHGYKWMNKQWQEEKLLHDGAYGAMGGLITSIESFSRYVAFHQYAWPPRNDNEKEPLKRSSLREMHKPWQMTSNATQYESPDNGLCSMTSAYGYGLLWSKECQSRVFIDHSGGLPGFGSNWIFMPDYGIGIVSFGNVTYAPMKALNLKLLSTLIKSAQLYPLEMAPSQLLKDRQNALIEFLPQWDNALKSTIFAENFFLDSSIAALKKQTTELFTQAGKIKGTTDVVPENQLRGSFIIVGENMNIKVKFTLTPENPALIQAVEINKAD